MTEDRKLAKLRAANAREYSTSNEVRIHYRDGFTNGWHAHDAASLTPPVPAEPWPPRDVLARLASFADFMLANRYYDGDGHEELRVCVERAQEILAALSAKEREP